MKKFLACLFGLAIAITPLSLLAEDLELEEKQGEDDMEALRRWVRDKRLVTVKELGGDLSISGEVRTEAQAISENKNDIKQRGSNSATGKPTLGYDAEFSFMMDYRRERSWAVLKLKFDDDMAVQDGTVDRIALAKAYLGGRVIDGDIFTWDIEVGRRFLIDVFDSRVEFGSLFDGLLFRLSQATEAIGDIYLNLGAFIINERKSHYGYIGELGFLNIANTGFFFKGSFIDWRKSPPNPSDPKTYRTNYQVTQLQPGYFFTPTWLKKLFKLYAAVLYNDCAQRLPVTNNELQNLGWYAGMSIGQIKKAWDWAIDVNYQWMQAQVVPEFDCIGIGRGNAAGVGMYTANINGEGVATTNRTAVGSNNYFGWNIEFLYAFTDNIVLFQNFKLSWTLDKNIGPNVTYKMFEVEMRYAF